MAWFWKLRETIQGLFSRLRLDREMNEEMQFYLDQLIERHIDRGLDPDEARLAAQREFGTADHWQESMRRERGGHRIAGILRDLRHSFLSLRRDPGFSLVVVLTLAFGIGLNTAVFGVLKAVYLDPLPLPEPDRVVFLNETSPDQGAGPVAYANYLDWKERSTTCAAMGAIHDSHLNITDGDEPVRVRIARLTETMTAVLGIVPARGRMFGPGDEESGGMVLLSYRLWRGRYGADPDLVGGSIEVDGEPYAVVGIMPTGFILPSTRAETRPFDLFLPMPAASRMEPRRVHSYQVMARLAAGESPASASAEMATIAGQLAAEYPESNEGRGVVIESVHRALYGEAGRQILLVLAAAALVLVIACANIAALQLARTLRQNREYAIRSTLGADRSRLVSQLLGESALLAVTGGVIAWLTALWGTAVLRNLIPPEIPRSGEIRLDATLFLFSLAAALVSGLLFGLGPALLAARTDPAQVLRQGRTGTAGGAGRMWSRRALVAGQFALSLLLANTALLLIQSHASVRRTDPGFGNRSVLTMAVNLSGPDYRDLTSRSTVYRDLLPRLEELPGVQAVGASLALPLEFESQLTPVYCERTDAAGSAPGECLVNLNLVTGDYHAAMGIPILRGRALTLDDMLASRLTNVTGVLVNQTLAHQLWPGDDPLGKRISIYPGGGRWMEVVGVIADTRQRGLTAASEPEFIAPYSLLFLRRMFLTVQTDQPVETILPAIRTEIARIDPTLPVSDVRTMEQILTAQFTGRGFSTLLVGLFAVLALIMAAIGIYGIVAYSVAQQTREIGIRFALGAQKNTVLTGVLGQMVRIAAAGIAVGLAGIVISTRILSGFLYAIRPLDLPTLLGAVLFLTLTGVVAAWLPARRAARVSPLVALRQE